MLIQTNLFQYGSKKFLLVIKALDEKGRRRFHGAFTGGFSAGYFNTVGSKEGAKCLMQDGRQLPMFHRAPAVRLE
jgi:hypothetical protein